MKRKLGNDIIRNLTAEAQCPALHEAPKGYGAVEFILNYNFRILFNKNTPLNTSVYSFQTISFVPDFVMRRSLNGTLLNSSSYSLSQDIKKIP